MSRVGEAKTQSACAEFEALFVELARLFRQHDRHAVADWVSKPRRARYEFLTGGVVAKLRPRHRAHENLKQSRVDLRSRRGLGRRRRSIRFIAHLAHQSVRQAGSVALCPQVRNSFESDCPLRTAEPSPAARPLGGRPSPTPRAVRGRRSTQERSPSPRVRPGQGRMSRC